MNAAFTWMTIEFHKEGYEFDFLRDENDLLRCLQTYRKFPTEAAVFWLMSQVNHGFPNSLKHLFWVEEQSRTRGVLLADEMNLSKCICLGTQIAFTK